MALSCCSASAATSPRRSNFSKQRCLKSTRNGSQIVPQHGIHKRSPAAHSTCARCVVVSPANSSTIWRKHLLASNIRSIVSRHSQIERYTVNFGAASSKPTMSGPGDIREQRTIPTPAVAANASVHEPSITNLAFAHSFKSGDGFKAAMASLLRVLGYRCTNSAEISGIHGNIVKDDAPELSGMARHRWVKSMESN